MRSAIGYAALLMLVGATVAEAQQAPRRFTLEGRGGADTLDGGAGGDWATSIWAFIPEPTPAAWKVPT